MGERDPFLEFFEILWCHGLPFFDFFFRFRKFRKNFRTKKWPKNAIKVNFGKNFAFKKFFRTPLMNCPGNDLNGVNFFDPLNSRYPAIFLSKH